MAGELTQDVLRSKRAEYVNRLDTLSVEVIALQGAIQALDELLGENDKAELPTLGEVVKSAGLTLAEDNGNENKIPA